MKVILARLSPSGYTASERATRWSRRAPLCGERRWPRPPPRSSGRARWPTPSWRATESRRSRPSPTGLRPRPPSCVYRAEQAAESIAVAVVPAFVALERHPAPEMRARAIQFLAKRKEDQAEAAVASALSNPDETVQRVAVSAVGAAASQAVVRGVASLLQQSPSWSLRVRAAEALGRIGPPATPPGDRPFRASRAKTPTPWFVRRPCAPWPKWTARARSPCSSRGAKKTPSPATFSCQRAHLPRFFPIMGKRWPTAPCNGKG